VLFIPSWPGATSLTGASDWSDRCEPFVGFASGELLVRVSLGCAVAGRFLVSLELFC
jgi:hypothetical protein